MKIDSTTLKEHLDFLNSRAYLIRQIAEKYSHKNNEFYRRANQITNSHRTCKSELFPQGNNWVLKATYDEFFVTFLFDNSVVECQTHELNEFVLEQIKDYHKKADLVIVTNEVESIVNSIKKLPCDVAKELIEQLSITSNRSKTNENTVRLFDTTEEMLIVKEVKRAIKYKFS